MYVTFNNTIYLYRRRALTALNDAVIYSIYEYHTKLYGSVVGRYTVKKD
jgi:hypothetical protein